MVEIEPMPERLKRIEVLRELTNNLPPISSPELKIAEQARLLSDTIKYDPSAVIVVCEIGLILLANDALCEMFGYAREELAGKSVDVLVPIDLVAAHVLGRKKFLLQGKSPLNLVVSGRHKDGTIISGIRARIAIIDVDGGTLGKLGVAYLDRREDAPK